MPSKTSSSKKEWFSKAMFLQTTNTFLPIPIIYFLILFLALPMDIFMWEIDIELYTDVYKDLADYAEMSVFYGLTPNFFFAVLSAMLVFRYLCNNRSANMVHSLPISREALFVTEYLAGLSFVIVPNILILALTLIALSFHGIFYATPFLYLFAVNCGLYFFFYNFAVLCAMFTGSIGGTTIFYLIFNFVVAFVVMLLDPIFDMYYLGYSSSILDYPFIRLLTPVYALIGAGSVDVSYKTTSQDMFAPGGFFYLFPENIIYTMENIDVFYWYTAAAVVFVVVSLFIYKGRHIEFAGEAVAIPVLKPVVRFSLAVIGGLSMGILSTFLIIDSVEDPSAFYLLPFFSLLFGVVFTFVAEMIMQKSFRVLQYWKRSCFPLIAIAIIYSCMYFDLTGFENTIPVENEVVQVSLRSSNTYPMDEATGYYTLSKEKRTLNSEKFEEVVRLHKAGLENNRRYLETYAEVDNFDEKSFMTLRYSLVDDSSLNRSYENITINKEDLEDPDSFASILLGMVNNREHLEERYLLNDLSGNVISTVLHNVFDEESDDFKMVKVEELKDDLSKSELRNLYEALAIAVVQDFEEGNIGQKFMFQDDEEFVEGGMPLKIEFVIELDELDEIENLSSVESDENEESSPQVKSLGDSGALTTQRITKISLSQSSVHTLAVLEEFEVLGDYKAITNQEHLEKAVGWYQEMLASDGNSRKLDGYYAHLQFDETDPLSFVQELK